MTTPGLSFMKTPLVTWVQSFRVEPLTYIDLTNGVFLNAVMHEIDSRSVIDSVVSSVEDVKDRVHNWDILLKNIKAYYQDVLQQLIVMKLPNIVLVGREPESDAAHGELEKTLLLLLGCSIQCEQQEVFIENIKLLDVEVQQSIVECIKEITDESKNVFAVDAEADLGETPRHMLRHLRRLVAERDGLWNEIKGLSGALDDLRVEHQQLEAVSQAQKTAAAPPGAPASGSSPEKHHAAVELAECKAKLRRLRQEAEDKGELVLELQEELDEYRETAGKLRTENLDLTQDARSARALRDEVDILKDKASRLDKAETEISKYKEKLNEMEYFKTRVEELREDNAVLVETRNMLEEQLSSCHKRIEAVIEVEQDLISYKEQVSQLQQNQKLQQQLEEVQDLQRLGGPARMKELEKENKKLSEASSQLQKEIQKLQKSEEFVQELENSQQTVEEENEQLRRSVASLKLTCEKYEQIEVEKSSVDIENRKLSRMVESLQKSISKCELAEKENINLNVELQRYKRTVETAKDSSSRVIELEHDKDMLNHEIQQLKKSLTSQKGDQLKLEQLELELMDLDTENQKLQRSLEAVTRRADSFERDNQELESQAADLAKTVEGMRLNARRLQEVEKNCAQLEKENTQMHREKANFEKENKRLKQNFELKDSTVDELSTKLNAIERENKSYVNEIERKRDLEAKLKDYEKDNMEIIQQAKIDKKTIATLREDLVNEKIRTQQLNNEREQLRVELDKIGLNTEKLVAADNTEGDNRYRLLESMMNDAQSNSLAIKEERINALESRLRESMERNSRLQEQIKDVRTNYEALQQRRDEDIMLQSAPSHRTRSQSHTTEPNPTKEILELKDHLVMVERKNATLEAEKKSLQSQVVSLQDQATQLRTQANKHQSQTSTVTSQNAALQSQLAKIQVENTTLTAQVNSLHSQISSLQKERGQLDSRRQQLQKAQEHLITTHDGLLSDHEQLQKIHEQLSSEYEALISEHGSLKANHKALKSEMRSLQDDHSLLLREKETVAELKHVFRQDKEQIQSESRSMGHLQMDMIQLKEDNMRLQSVNDRIQREYRDLLSEEKSYKTEYNQLQLKNSELQSTLSRCRDQLRSSEVDLSKMSSKCEYISQLNVKLEEDNRALLMQVQALLTQNQELLMTSLESKDHFAEEQKANMERVADLSRQKERLEEKIMEQYRRYDPIKKKNKSFGANFVKRARQMLSSDARARSRSKDRSQMSLQESPESSVFGSDPYGDSDKNHRKPQRRGSVDNALDDRPNNDASLQQKRPFTQSTTALNMLEYQHGSSTFAMRGAKSTENLNSSLNNSEWPSTPGRRRTLMNNNCDHNIDRSESMNSEEGRRTRTTTSTDADEADGEEIGEISLDQFLAECDRSPKSRRKFLVDRKIDLQDASECPQKEESKTTILHPELGARAPTVDEAEAEKDANMSRRCKSEMNISQTSRTSSNHFSNKHDNRLNYVAEGHSQPAYATTPRKISDYGSGFSEKYRTKSVGEGLSNGAYDEPKGSASSNSSDSPFNKVPRDSRAFQGYTDSSTPVHSASIPRQNSTSSSSSSANIGAYNAMTRQTTAGPNNHAVHRPPSVAEQPYSPQRHLPQRPSDTDPYTARSSAGQYQPVRPHGRQYPPPPPEYSDIPKGHSAPVPPPRRTRPMSAGPLPSSSNSAFSVPPQRTLSPSELNRATSMPPPEQDYQDVRPKMMSRPDTHLSRSSSGRVLPQAPGETPRSMRPGSTPPRPSNKDCNPPATPKSSVWPMYPEF
ncbi:hypothetical protein CAPTEDRAFT_219709 [Capitella teleta]|uniref:HOOK N-terminal domain-containing protein n=1 Tax=Capitella teleta TaxID=283909 RepID=R7U4W0_CAPTE|nr:hypothetical protein CAPTEDRAFT_219709 [Capitella teleta]|eukprot:ELU01156.1 hypothetical protein CAPTEDRAFT_219709 [Capitella teleta]